MRSHVAILAVILSVTGMSAAAAATTTMKRMNQRSKIVFERRARPGSITTNAFDNRSPNS